MQVRVEPSGIACVQPLRLEQPPEGGGSAWPYASEWPPSKQGSTKAAELCWFPPVGKCGISTFGLVPALPRLTTTVLSQQTQAHRPVLSPAARLRHAPATRSARQAALRLRRGGEAGSPAGVRRGQRHSGRPGCPARPAGGPGGPAPSGERAITPSPGGPRPAAPCPRLPHWSQGRGRVGLRR